MILTLVFSFVQVPDMSSPGNPMAWIMSVEPLTGANYPQWREKINMGLALFEIDKAITDKRPVEPTLLDIPDDLGADAKAEREKQNSRLMRIPGEGGESVYWLFESICQLSHQEARF